MRYFETNFDGLVGPTHCYGGLSQGNRASIRFAKQIANPQQAALQGLAKMYHLHQLGLHQGVFAPAYRPSLHWLRQLGFSGNTETILKKVHHDDPLLLLNAYSASSMWAANMATVSPSLDCLDGRVHITPANLINKLHRSIETVQNAALLKRVFNSPKHFCHHSPLPAQRSFSDEGAANHSRLCQSHANTGLEVFVYGFDAFKARTHHCQRFEPRHSRQACESIARAHQLNAKQVLILEQQARAIDAGVFHNDVIMLANENVVLFHQHAFSKPEQLRASLSAHFTDSPIYCIEISEHELSLDEAVTTYFFNSQLLTLKPEHMLLLAPIQCQHSAQAMACIERLLSEDNPIKAVSFIDLQQSMQNGGGPACLRLRAVLNEAQLGGVNSHCLLNDERYAQLCEWVKRHYRDRLSLDELRDPKLIDEVQCALDELTGLLGLGSLYEFQT